MRKMIEEIEIFHFSFNELMVNKAIKCLKMDEKLPKIHSFIEPTNTEQCNTPNNRHGCVSFLLFYDIHSFEHTQHVENGPRRIKCTHTTSITLTRNTVAHTK